MEKEKYLSQLYLFDKKIKKLREGFKKKWPEQPSFDSLKHEEWYRDVLTIWHLFPEIEFGCFFSGNKSNAFLGRKPIWVDPSIRNKKGLDEFEGNEREELLFKLRREKGRLLFESVRMAIPIYPDTTKEDIEKIWHRIEEIKKIAYNHIPKPKKGKLEGNIMIYRFGQFQETIKELTGKDGVPWSNIADQMGISPQACRERYQSIKKFVNFNLTQEAEASNAEAHKEIIIQNLDCSTCKNNKDCELFNTRKGNCPFVEKILGKGEISSQSHISVDQFEKKEARDYGHWKAEDEFLDSLDID